jgi:hypothetical protein
MQYSNFFEIHMSKLEFCRAILQAIGGHWPYPDALADAAKMYSMKTVEQAVSKINQNASTKRKKHL